MFQLRHHLDCRRAITFHKIIFLGNRMWKWKYAKAIFIFDLIVDVLREHSEFFYR